MNDARRTKYELIAYALVVPLSLLLGYLVIASIEWELNPGEWPKPARFLSLLASVGAGFGAGAVVHFLMERLLDE